MIIRAITFMFIGILFGIGIFSYAFFDSYGKLATKHINKTKALEKEIALHTTSDSAINYSPVYLFDIKLEMDNIKITQTDTLSARVVLTNFGTVHTPVAMNFTIIDTYGERAGQEAVVIIVQTEKIYIKEFKSLKLRPGNYTLILETIYGNNVEDEFSQEFEVKRKKFLGIF